jgi:hypothetical protein
MPKNPLNPPTPNQQFPRRQRKQEEMGRQGDGEMR